MGSKRTPLLYKDKPLFGLDVGTGSLKVMQIAAENIKHPAVLGYASSSFDAKAVLNSEIIDPQTVAKAVLEMFQNKLAGDISTHRVALSIPAARTFTREMQLPKLANSELTEAVRAEAEQYIPRPLDELYLDYTINGARNEQISVYIVAVPKKIVDSYYTLARILGLEAVFIEPSISAAVRLLMLDEQNRMPSVLVDFGTRSADISIFDTNVVVTGTVQSAGGDLFTERIMEALKVTHEEAVIIKTKYGLGLSKKQKEINEALKPLLDDTLREIRRMIRYYEDRNEGEHKIKQIITMGGGANMPGLSDYVTANLRLPTRMSDPWQMLDFGKLKPPGYAERSIYMTVAGLALAQPKEIFS